MGSTSWSPQAQKSEPRLDIFFLYVGRLWGPQILMELTELVLKWTFSSDRQDRCKPSMLTSFMWHGRAACHFHSPREVSAQKQKVLPKDMPTAGETDGLGPKSRMRATDGAPSAQDWLSQIPAWLLYKLRLPVSRV